MESTDLKAVKTPAGAFPNTRWSVVVNAKGQSTAGARAALSTLCELYWYPLYTFVRRQGRSHHEAEDCTQSFLAQLLARGRIAKARPERGRFRSFLLAGMRNFLIDDWQKLRAEKRGGGAAPLPLEFTGAEETYNRELTDQSRTPEQAFDHSWASSMVLRSLETVKAEYEKSGRGETYTILAPAVWGNEQAEWVTKSATKLNISKQALAVALHRLRNRVAARLRAEVAETVESRDDIDEELRYLISAAFQGRD